jgi:predicted MFS family arabinose efflux permease
MTGSEIQKRKNLQPVEWLNFFLADVQTGLGPFLAAYLASSAWNPGSVGYLLTFGGLASMVLQAPAGAIVDSARRKRRILACSIGVLVVGAIILMGPLSTLSVYSAQFLIACTGPFLGPTVAAITLGMVGAKAFSKQFGRNQSFNSAGNVFTALLIAYVSYKFGYRAIFATAVLMAIPALISTFMIDPKQIDYNRSRGASHDGKESKVEGLMALLKDRVLLSFLATAFLFHLSNAAMLPQLGEMLTKGNAKAAAPFMSACIIVTQVVIAVGAGWVGMLAGTKGRKPLLLIGFGVLPLRGVLYTLTHSTPALIAIQTLDGVANAIFGVVSILVISDLTRGTGRFNFTSGALATMVGLGAALSTTLGGQLVQHFGFSASFLGLATVALVAVGLLWVTVPETLSKNGPDNS